LICAADVNNYKSARPPLRGYQEERTIEEVASIGLLVPLFTQWYRFHISLVFL